MLALMMICVLDQCCIIHYTYLMYVHIYAPAIICTIVGATFLKPELIVLWITVSFDTSYCMEKEQHYYFIAFFITL